jgi:two-component system, cell cycle response regulator CtrA
MDENVNNPVAHLLSLLEASREQLTQSKAAVARTLALVEDGIAAASELAAKPGNYTVETLLGHYKDELIASALAAIDRRAEGSDPPEWYSELIVLPDRRSVQVGRRKVHLTDSEFEIIELLWTKSPQVVSRADVLDQLYGPRPRPSERTIDVFISHIRQKLKLASGGEEFIEAVRGRGWLLRPHAGSVVQKVA